MQNPRLIRTATVASLAAAMIVAGWMGSQGDEMQVDPAGVGATGAQTEPGYYFPAEYMLQPNPAEVEPYEFY
jgi:hypothetical protein